MWKQPYKLKVTEEVSASIRSRCWSAVTNHQPRQQQQQRRCMQTHRRSDSNRMSPYHRWTEITGSFLLQHMFLCLTDWLTDCLTADSSPSITCTHLAALNKKNLQIASDPPTPASRCSWCDCSRWLKSTYFCLMHTNCRGSVRSAQTSASPQPCTCSAKYVNIM